MSDDFIADVQRGRELQDKVLAVEMARAQLMAGEINALRRRGTRISVPIEIEVFDLFRVIGALQLAYRHPSLSDDIRRAVEQFTRALQAAFDAQELPELARTLEQGWQREFDR